MGGCNIIPAIRYIDCQSAIQWLCDVLKFEKFVVYESDGIVHHAQLRFDNSLIMLGSYRNSPYDILIKVPCEIDQVNTQSPYIFLDDLDDFYRHVQSKGAEIVLPLKKEEHGSGFSVRDPEGYLWNFGDFNPWAPSHHNPSVNE